MSLKCSTPFYVKDKGIIVPCNQCLACRILRRRKWTARLLLEQRAHALSCFVTLTYNNENLPSDLNLDKKHCQDFLKRLRRAIEPHKIRYFLCGEYGETFGRPHYHAVIFGLPNTEEVRKLIEEKWGMGFVKIGHCVKDSMQYVAGYVAKKYTASDIRDFKSGRKVKEFVLMSRRPAIGTYGLEQLVESAFLQHPHDVISVISHGGCRFPLDRTMRNKLRNHTMAEEYLDRLKKAYTDKMRENLMDLIFENLSESEQRQFDRLEALGDSLAIEKLYTLLRKAYGRAYGSEIQAQQSLWHKRNRRNKDF